MRRTSARIKLGLVAATHVRAIDLHRLFARAATAALPLTETLDLNPRPRQDSGLRERL